MSAYIYKWEAIAIYKYQPKCEVIIYICEVIFVNVNLYTYKTYILCTFLEFLELRVQRSHST